MATRAHNFFAGPAVLPYTVVEDTNKAVLDFAGLGVSIISNSFAANEVHSGEVKLLALEDVELWRELGLIYRADRTLPRAATAFVELIQNRTRLRAKSKSAVHV